MGVLSTPINNEYKQRMKKMEPVTDLTKYRMARQKPVTDFFRWHEAMEQFMLSNWKSLCSSQRDFMRLFLR